MPRGQESRGSGVTARIALAATAAISISTVLSQERSNDHSSVKHKPERVLGPPIDLDTSKLSSFLVKLSVTPTTQPKPPVSTTTTTEAPQPPTPPTPVQTTSPAGILRRIAGCESGGAPDAPINYQAQNPTSSASGAFQVLDTTWKDFDGYSEAKLAPPAVQLEQAEQLYAEQGTSPWIASEACWN